MYNFLYYKDDEGIREPWFFENSKVPIILSYLAPIDIYAIAFGPWVWCRGELDAELKNGLPIFKLSFEDFNLSCGI